MEIDLKDLTAWFAEQGIDYTDRGDGWFDLKGGELQVRYVESESHKTDFSKRFGIAGIEKGYFVNISKKNREQEIRTIWLKDFEYADKRKNAVVKSYIKTACGKVENSYYARDCEVRKITAKELRPFLEQNCFYGFRAGTVYLGLYAKKTKGSIEAGTLLMVYTFGHPFFGKGRYDVEVIRVATQLNTQVTGGASKLLKHFITNYKTLQIGPREVPVNKICFYVDADHNDGRSLEKLGFEFIEWTGAGFMNITTATGLASHRDPMNHKLIMEKMSRGEMFSIENAGTIVYCFTVGVTKLPGEE
jgi:hypothetical protein